MGRTVHGPALTNLSRRAGLSGEPSVTAESSRRFRTRLTGAVAGFALALPIFALNEHAPMDVSAGMAVRLTAGVVPLLAACVVALAIWRPWAGFLAVLLFTPVVDTAQMSWQIGNVQIIGQTVFLIAIMAGLLLRPELDLALRLRQRMRPRSLEGGAAIALIGLIALATASTIASPNPVSSATVLLHGILEPIAMGGLLLVLCPGRRGLVLAAVALGLSVALGGLMNMAQTLPTAGSLAALQANRLLFSRTTFFNVGLFGEMLAMALPLLVGALLGRRALGLRHWLVVAVGVATLVCGAGLFLTFSKSAWLASGAGCLVVVLLAVNGWRRRASIVLAAGLLSSVLIPWPMLVLQGTPPLADAYRDVMVRVVGESRFDSWDPATLSGRGSLLERFYATRAALAMAIDHPLLGVGLDQFKTEYVDHYRQPPAVLNQDSAHEMWAEQAAELGFPVLALALLIYGSAFVALSRVYRSPPDERTRQLAAAWIASLVAWMLVATAFAGDMYRPWRIMSADFIMMAVLVAGAFALYRYSRRAVEAQTARLSHS